MCSVLVSSADAERALLAIINFCAAADGHYQMNMLRYYTQLLTLVRSVDNCSVEKILPVQAL